MSVATKKWKDENLATHYQNTGIFFRLIMKMILDNRSDKILAKFSTLNCCEYTSHRAMALTKADYTAIAEETNVSGDQTMER